MSTYKKGHDHPKAWGRVVGGEGWKHRLQLRGHEHVERRVGGAEQPRDLRREMRRGGLLVVAEAEGGRLLERGRELRQRDGLDGVAHRGAATVEGAVELQRIRDELGVARDGGHLERRRLLEAHLERLVVEHLRRDGDERGEGRGREGRGERVGEGGGGRGWEGGVSTFRQAHESTRREREGHESTRREGLGAGAPKGRGEG